MKNLIFTISILFTVLSFSQNTNANKEKFAPNYANVNLCKPIKPLLILDGKIITEKLFKTLDPNKIKSINVFKHEKATFLYGNRAKNGVVVITTKTKKELRKERRKVNRKRK